MAASRPLSVGWISVCSAHFLHGPTMLGPAVVTRRLATGCPTRRPGASPRVFQCSGMKWTWNFYSPSRQFFTFHKYSIFINLVHNPNINAAVHMDVAREQLLAAVSGCPHFGRLGVETPVLLLKIVYLFTSWQETALLWNKSC